MIGNKKSSGIDHHGDSALAAQGAPGLVGLVPVGGCWLMFMMLLPSAGIQEGFSQVSPTVLRITEEIVHCNLSAALSWFPNSHLIGSL